MGLTPGRARSTAARRAAVAPRCASASSAGSPTTSPISGSPPASRPEFADTRGPGAANNREANAGRHIPVDGEYLPATPPFGQGHASRAGRARTPHRVPPSPRSSRRRRCRTAHGAGPISSTCTRSRPRSRPLSEAPADGRPRRRRRAAARLCPAPKPPMIPAASGSSSRPTTRPPRLQTPWTAFRVRRAPGAPRSSAPPPSPDPVGERVAHGMLDLGFRERYDWRRLTSTPRPHKTLNAAMTPGSPDSYCRARSARPTATPPPALRSHRHRAAPARPRVER